MLNPAPLVSIIIPLYNAENYIAATIESALKQTYTNTEIIIVDDGSKDASYEVAIKYASDKIKVVKQVNKGASAARNHGISLAKGDYIQFLDADDFLHPQKIEQQVSTLSKFSDLHLIGGTWQRFITNLDHLFGEIAPPTLVELQFFDKAKWLIDRPMMIPHTWLVSKKLIELAGPWDEALTLNDDGEYFYRAIAASAGVIIDKKAKTYYRSFNSSSLSSKNGRAAMLSWIASIKSYKKILQQVAGNLGNTSVDQYFDLLSYWCLNEYNDLYQLCRNEMYDPKKNYRLEDNLVQNLSIVTGRRLAKKIRTQVNQIKSTVLLRTLIYKFKVTRGKSAY